MLYNKLGWDKRTRLRQAAVYCGYFFESGPWREALISWGVDPRKDPQYRKYQTVSFMSYKKRGTARHHDGFDKHVQELSRMTAEQLEHQHTFDGVRASDTGNTFQFCDITDPMLAKILATDDIRTTCAPTFQGWYHVGTWAKVTVLLKDKMNTIIGGAVPDDALYERVCQWPELWDDKDIFDTYRDEVNDREIHDAKRREHDIMHSVRIAARNPRYAFEKMEKMNDIAVSTTEILDPESAEDLDIPEDLTEYPDDPDTAEAISNDVAQNNDSSDSEDDDDDDDDEDGYDEEDDYDVQDQEQVEDEDGIWEEDEDEGSVVTPAPAVSAGPTPFGGLYNV